MDSKVLIVQNVTREEPGLLKEILEEKEQGYQIVNLEAGDAIPELKGYSALVVLGGTQSANDDTEHMRLLTKRVAEALKLGLPYLGICLGLQVLVKAAGGTVVPSPVKEIGWRDASGEIHEIELTEEGKNDDLFSQVMGERFPIFHLHNETVELTDAMTLLATGKNCQNQVVRVGNAFGVQGHFEVTPALFDKLVAEDEELRQISATELKSDFQKVEKEFHEFGKQVLKNFLSIAAFEYYTS
ncbi:MAG: type 1 glutamine amidotransferase [bacterium]|nr:type 1 glutamine amidotransferase [bacterium]